jgi:hypothetical protein
MDITFRKWPTDNGATPAANEIWLLPVDRSQRDGRRLAELVLERGIEALRQGTGPIETVVVQHDPTLDDMLAAELVCRRLQSPSEPWPGGMAAFARYARLVREGHRPTRFDLENTIEAIFLAIRTRAGENLTEPERAAEFLAGWRPLAERIVESAAADVDPFRTELFGPGHEFAEQRAWLLADREVYRHDVARGQQWNVRLPGGPPQAAALVLVDPKSLSFHRFCRIDPEAPGGFGYALLVVRRQEGVRWILSTDRAQRISLQGLAQQLQQAEAARDAAGAAADPWFDGAPYEHTLIAAPRHGTRLTDEEVLRIVRRWAQAQSGARPGSGLGQVAAKWAVAAALLVAASRPTSRIIRTPAVPRSARCAAGDWRSTMPNCSPPRDGARESIAHC